MSGHKITEHFIEKSDTFELQCAKKVHAKFLTLKQQNCLDNFSQDILSKNAYNFLYNREVMCPRHFSSGHFYAFSVICYLCLEN